MVNPNPVGNIIDHFGDYAKTKKTGMLTSLFSQNSVNC